MSNVVDFTKAKRDKKTTIDPLERAKKILLPKKAQSKSEVINKIKDILRSKGIKYRISHKEILAIECPKNQSILIPEKKLAFVISETNKKIHTSTGWVIEHLKLDNKSEAINYIGRIILRIKELVQNEE